MKGGGGGDSVASKKTRSQNEGLDYCGVAEIEAGDLRDGKAQSNYQQKSSFRLNYSIDLSSPSLRFFFVHQVT